MSVEEQTAISVKVRIPTALRRLTKGQAETAVSAATLADLVSVLEEQFPGMRERLVDEAGQARRFINMYVNGEDMRFLQGLSTTLKAGDEVSIVPAVAGGS